MLFIHTSFGFNVVAEFLHQQNITPHLAKKGLNLMRLVLFSYKLNCFHLLSLSLTWSLHNFNCPTLKKTKNQGVQQFFEDLSPFHFQSIFGYKSALHSNDELPAKIIQDFSLKKSQGLIMGKEMLLLIAFIACFTNTYQTKIF